MKVTLPHNGWKPRSYQKAAWKAARNPKIKKLVLAWARRHGKDEIAMHITAIKAMQRPGNYYHCLPAYSQARKAIWEAVPNGKGVARWREVFPEEIIKHVDNIAMKITFINGSTWQLVGSDNVDSLMGTSPAGVVFSEAALANPTTFAFFSPILKANGGWSIHISSTRGRNHFYELYQESLEDPEAFVSHISAADTDVFSDIDLAKERKSYERLYGLAVGHALFEQEYMSSWDGAVVGAVFSKEIEALTKEGRACPLMYDRRYPVDTSWDLGVGDDTVILFWQTIGNQERLIDWYSANDAGIDHFAEVIRAKPYNYGKHYAPHDIMVREWGANAVTRIKQAKRFGINFEKPKKVDKMVQIALASDLLSRTVMNVNEKIPEDKTADCNFILNAFRQYRFKYDDAKKIMSKQPVHDWTSHYMDAFMVKAIHSSSVTRPSSPELAPDDKFARFESVTVKEILASKRKTARGAWG